MRVVKLTLIITAAACFCGSADAEDGDNLAGVYTVTSKDRDYVGRVNIVPTEGAARDDDKFKDTLTYKLTWKINGDSFSGVGILKDDKLSVAWSGGVILYEVTDAPDGHKDLLGQSLNIGGPPNKFDETLRFFRELKPKERAVVYYDFEEGETVLANYIGSDEDASGWYYATILAICGDQYLIAYEAGDVPPESLSGDRLSRRKIREGAQVYTTLEKGNPDEYYLVTLAKLPEDLKQLADDDRIAVKDADGKEYKVKLKDDDGNEYERELKYLRVEFEDEAEPEEANSDSDDGEE